MRAILNSDGSWVMSVADGLGGHPFGDEAAQAAVEALPDRIASNAEMAEAFDAANAAVWELHPEMRSGSRPETSFIALTTLVVAAWTPENGLLVSWVGDSMAFLVPVGGGRGWRGRPHGTPSGRVDRCIGMVRSDCGDNSRLSAHYVDHLVDDVPAIRVKQWIEDAGVLVVLATDGLFEPILEAHDRDWFGNDPDDNSLGFALPPERRGCAADAADTLMDTARSSGLIDNTAIAVARISSDRAAAIVNDGPNPSGPLTRDI